MPYQAVVTFPGVTKIVRMTGTISHGISPSAFRIVCVPQASSIATQGDLVMTWNQYNDSMVLLATTTLTIPDCIVDTGSAEYDTDGALVSLSILDRRWKWRFGKVCGRYNLRNIDGSLVALVLPGTADAAEDTERTPQELAGLLLDAMGESGYDVADLPNDSRPKVEWDYENPARALAELVESLGCRVVLQLDDTVAIRVTGSGAALPTGAAKSISTEIDPPERPDSITVVTGRTRFQYDFELVAVGLDTDGKVKPIDDLSYAPLFGWAIGDTDEFMDIADAKDRQLAKQTVYRWYQINFDLFAVPVKLPPFGATTLDFSWLTSEIDDDQIEVVEEEGVIKAKKSIVYGSWWLENDREETNTGFSGEPGVLSGDDDKQIVDRAWSFDRKRKIVKFGSAIFKRDANFFIIPAKLRFRTAFHAAHPSNRCWHRVLRTRDKTGDWGTNNTEDLVIHADHIVPTYVASYAVAAPNTFLDANITWTDNLSTVNALADGYIDREVAKLNGSASASQTYAGLVLSGFELDGALQQVTWDVSTQQVTTRISRNTDQGSKTTIPYHERRAFEVLRQNKDQLLRQKQEQQRDEIPAEFI